MAREAKITEKRKAYVTLLRQECNLSYREIATRCKISKSSVERFCKQGMEYQPPKKGVVGLQRLAEGTRIVFSGSLGP